jgi:hypothetical protein
MEDLNKAGHGFIHGCLKPLPGYPLYFTVIDAERSKGFVLMAR